MATVLDVSLLESFSQLFVMLLVIFLVYGILDYTKLFGERKGLHALIALFLGTTILFVPSVGELIAIIIPWFVVLFIFVIFLLLVYGIFGAKEEEFLGVLKSPQGKQIIFWVIFFGAIILLGGLGKVFFTGEEATVKVTTEGTIQSGEVGETGTAAFWATLFHPKVLGMILILAIGIFTITLLTTQVKVES